MLVIIVTVVTQGARVDPELKGPVVGSLGIKSGIFQAIGVISFGISPLSLPPVFTLLSESNLTDLLHSICLP